MFDYIKIEGFRSFKSVELQMPRLAVLIGPNGGGKSNFVDLLMLMAEAAQGQLQRGIDRRGGANSITFGFSPFRYVSAELRFHVEFLPTRPPRRGESYPPLKLLRFKLGLDVSSVRASAMRSWPKSPHRRAQRPRLWWRGIPSAVFSAL